MLPRLLVAAALIAGAKTALAAPALRAPVVVPIMDFHARVDDGRVILSWRRYKRDDFKSYQLLKSTDTRLEYPDTPPLYSADSADRTRFEDGKLAVGTWRYRLCIVTVFGDRWVSPVVTVKIGPGDLRRDPPTEADFE